MGLEAVDILIFPFHLQGRVSQLREVSLPETREGAHRAAFSSQTSQGTPKAGALPHESPPMPPAQPQPRGLGGRCYLASSSHSCYHQTPVVHQ